MKIACFIIFLIYINNTKTSSILDDELSINMYKSFLKEFENLGKIEKNKYILSEIKHDEIDIKDKSNKNSNNDFSLKKSFSLKRSSRVYRKMSDESKNRINKNMTICVIFYKKYTVNIVYVNIRNVDDEIQHTILRKNTYPVPFCNLKFDELLVIDSITSLFLDDFLKHNIIPDIISCVFLNLYKSNFIQKIHKYDSFSNYNTYVEKNENLLNFKINLENAIFKKMNSFYKEHEILFNLKNQDVENNIDNSCFHKNLKNKFYIENYINKVLKCINYPLKVYSVNDDFIIAFYASKYIYNPKNVEMILGDDIKYFLYIKDDFIFNDKWSTFKPEILVLFYEEENDNDKNKKYTFLNFYNMENEILNTNKLNQLVVTDLEIFDFISGNLLDEKRIFFLDLIHKSFQITSAYIYALINIYKLKDVTIILNGYCFINKEQRCKFINILSNFFKNECCKNIKFNFIYEDELSILGAAYFHYVNLK
ncbi:hypothetical protein NAPIS_ORF01739 [Vairimorpha apis BRL 01]|uniref:Uncharacterized protein n=1 Tax=Vairimorpha apis BRL 01 TaxID=1037528 RepID=T0MBX6_9MICR|nr:hypothetical protein NAPIS_ORF01739 [Vairimorpha apis BRL 01]